MFKFFKKIRKKYRKNLIFYKKWKKKINKKNKKTLINTAFKQ